MRMSGSPVAGVLLAAGESARMGRPKAGLLWRGKTLLEYQTQSLQSAGREPVIAVLGAHAAMVRDGVSPGTHRGDIRVR